MHRQTMVCEKYAHIIQLKEKEIQLQKEINTSINEIQAAMKRQNERIRDLKKRLERITTLYVVTVG